MFGSSTCKQRGHQISGRNPANTQWSFHTRWTQIVIHAWCGEKITAHNTKKLLHGQEFLKRHTSVTFVMNGPEDPLTIGTPSTTTSAQLSVPVATLDPPRLFAFLLPESKPITSKSRRYSRDDSEFIQSEVKHLLAADIIEPARSPWRAQVLVVTQGTKRWLVIDYLLLSIVLRYWTLIPFQTLRNS